MSATVNPGPFSGRLTELLGCRYPIVQTAMGWISTPELVIASSNAGAFGFLAGATMSPAEIREAIHRIREATDQPFGVSFLMEQAGAEEIVGILVEEQVAAAGYNRGPDASLIEGLKRGGVKCVPTVGAIRHAEKAVELGADALLAQGGEGGGHTGTVATNLLVAQIRDRLGVPFAAAGGFHDGRGLVAALALGADGIAMGTRFLLTAECLLDDAAAERYFAARIEDTTVTAALDGLPQRVIRNELLTGLEGGTPLARYRRAFASALEYRRITGQSFKQLIATGLRATGSGRLTRSQALLAAIAPVLVRRALREGRAEEGILPTGQVTGVIDDRPSCRDLVERIMNEAETALEELNRGGVRDGD